MAAKGNKTNINHYNLLKCHSEQSNQWQIAMKEAKQVGIMDKSSSQVPVTGNKELTPFIISWEISIKRLTGITPFPTMATYSSLHFVPN